jgi:hypothetical protein
MILRVAFRLPYNRLSIFMLYLTAQSSHRTVLHVTHVYSLTGQIGMLFLLQGKAKPDFELLKLLYQYVPLGTGSR